MSRLSDANNAKNEALFARVSYDSDTATQLLCSSIDAALAKINGQSIAIVCVGTDRSTGDAFGPIIGTKLLHCTKDRDLLIYGTLDEPVHAINLSSTLQCIQQSFRTPPFILAIDACLGRFEHVGDIIFEKGPLRPGAGVKKSLPEFGDYTLTGVVNVSGFMEYFVLQNTRLGIVMQMCDIVVEALKLSLLRHQMRKKILEAH